LLSLAAHAVFIAIAATIRFVSLPPGAGQDEPVRVTIVAAAPQPSINAPDARVATPEEPADDLAEELMPRVATESPAPQPVPVTQAEPEAALTPPDLMPDPRPTQDAQLAPVAEPTAREAEPPMDQQPAEQVAASSASQVAESAPPSTPPPAPPEPDVAPATAAVPASLAERIRPDRLQSVIEQGGSRETEQAVGLALEWLAYAQSADGRWDADRWQGGREFRILGHNRNGAGAEADTGITGLALLTFLGAGHTHRDGPYQQHVARGLVYLMQSQDAEGNLAAGASFYARTYSHSMATFALGEAYALTGDNRLEQATQRAIDYVLRCENKSFGGWRYNAGDQGDVSQLGWMIMALRSAEIAGIQVPDDTWQRIEVFLQRVARGRHGGLAAYQARTDWSRSMTAEAMYCRQVLGKALAGPPLGEALGALSDELPGDGPTNYYYWYYATLALHHARNDNSAAAHTWERWNEQLKRDLVAAQVTDGSNAGSWSPNTVWGGYGGRVYSTAMAAMCLEVYYRYGSGAVSPWVASRPRGEPSRK
jgi:hypothetical protein